MGEGSTNRDSEWLIDRRDNKLVSEWVSYLGIGLEMRETGWGWKVVERPGKTVKVIKGDTGRFPFGSGENIGWAFSAQQSPHWSPPQSYNLLQTIRKDLIAGCISFQFGDLPMKDV